MLFYIRTLHVRTLILLIKQSLTHIAITILHLHFQTQLISSPWILSLNNMISSINSSNLILSTHFHIKSHSLRILILSLVLTYQTAQYYGYSRLLLLLILKTRSGAFIYKDSRLITLPHPLIRNSSLTLISSALSQTRPTSLLETISN